MSPSKISERILADRLDWIEKMTREIRSHLRFRTLAGYRNRMVHFYHEILMHS